MKTKQNLLQNHTAAMLLTLLCMIAWSSAFPLIKLGLAALEVASTDTAAKMLFAGIRFTLAGGIVLLLALAMKRDFHIGSKENWSLLVIFTLVNTSLRYFFFYIGLSNLPGARSSIIDSMNAFLLVVLACRIFPEEKMTKQKVIGCILGILGVIAVNINGAGLTDRFTLMGDGMQLGSVVTAAFGGILTRIVTRRMDAIVATGFSLGVGGVVLAVLGWLLGGRITVMNPTGAVVLGALVCVSAFSFVLYNQILCWHPVSEIAIFNAVTPVMGVILSCAMLGEPFLANYVIAGGLVAAGVVILNRKTMRNS